MLNLIFFFEQVWPSYFRFQVSWYATFNWIHSSSADYKCTFTRFYALGLMACRKCSRLNTLSCSQSTQSVTITFVFTACFNRYLVAHNLRVTGITLTYLHVSKTQISLFPNIIRVTDSLKRTYSKCLRPISLSYLKKWVQFVSPFDAKNEINTDYK